MGAMTGTGPIKVPTRASGAAGPDVRGPTPSGGQMTLDGTTPKVHVIVRCRDTYRVYEIARKGFKLIQGPNNEFGQKYVTATFEVEEARVKEFRKVARGSIMMEVPV